MRNAEVLELLRDAGVLLESAHGSIPNVAELVAGEKIRGRWWSHPASHRIFPVTRGSGSRWMPAVSSREDIRMPVT